MHTNRITAAQASAQAPDLMTTLPHGSDLPRACVECDQPCRYLTCVDCGEGAYVIDCGHYQQPAHIAASAHGGDAVCAGCEITRDELAMTGSR